MTPQELRREYAGRDADGDLQFTIHVSRVAQLLKDKDWQIKQLEQDNDKLKDQLSMLQKWLSTGIFYSFDELVEHDAKVIDQFIKEIDDLGFVVETGEFSSAWVIDAEEIKNHAQSRQKSQEKY